MRNLDFALQVSAVATTLGVLASRVARVEAVKYPGYLAEARAAPEVTE